MIENMIENPWFVSIVSGIVCGILLPIVWHTINYFTDEQKWKRKRLKCCKLAIYNMIQKFNISASIGHPLGPILTYTNYILVLYELYFVINGQNSSQISNKKFLADALSWHQSYVNQHMQNAIEVYSPLEIENLLCEVNSYGKNGKSFIVSKFPNFSRYLYRLRNFCIKKFNNVNYVNCVNKKLYGNGQYKLPPVINHGGNCYSVYINGNWEYL